MSNLLTHLDLNVNETLSIFTFPEEIVTAPVITDAFESLPSRTRVQCKPNSASDWISNGRTVTLTIERFIGGSWQHWTSAPVVVGQLTQSGKPAYIQVETDGFTGLIRTRIEPSAAVQMGVTVETED